MTTDEAIKMSWQNDVDNDIYNAVNDWGGHRFISVMKDNTIQYWSGGLDENYNGEISQCLYCENDEYDSDDIVFWIEVPNV